MPSMNRKQKKRQKQREKKKREKEAAAAAAAAADSPASPPDAPAVVADYSTAEGDALKAKGNAALGAGNINDAIKYYTSAIDAAPRHHVYYSNRSAAYMRAGQFEDARADGKKCTELNPRWAKGYSRLGCALLSLGKSEDAMRAYAQGLTVDPTSQTLLDGLTEARLKLQSLKLGEETASKKKEKKTEKKDATSSKKKQTKKMGHVIGIDLGTTYSCCAVWESSAEDGVTIIPDREGNRTSPSIVAYLDGGTRLIGHAAKRQAASNPLRTIFGAKRILGSSMDDLQVAKDAERFPFQVVRGSEGQPVIHVEDGVEVRPEEISAAVLRHMKSIAEDYLGEPVEKAVITVPAYFNDAQRQATKSAGAIAGLDVLRIINEPTAAALAYGLDMGKGVQGGFADNSDGRNVIVFDLGGGTFDVSLLNIDGGIFEVLATGGNTHLGGEDFDNALVDHVVKMIAAKKKIKVKSLLSAPKELGLNPRAMKRIRIACERAKRQLSSAKTTKMHIDALFPDGEDFAMDLTRAKFDQINEKPFKLCIDTVKRVLKDAKLAVVDVDDVVLVGGSTRIPRVQEILKSYFKGKDLCKSINPDEAVAYGAAVQGAILSGNRSDAAQQLLLVDVTPLSLGIECVGKIFSVVIPRNTSIPCKRTKIYTTEENFQEFIEVPVYEGERQCVDGNNLLGEFEIKDIERAKRGVPQIEVTFSLDANGILNVSAKDKKTGSSAEISLAKGSSRLSEEEIERMVKDAEKHAAADAKRVAEQEAKSELEGLVYDLRDSASSQINEPSCSSAKKEKLAEIIDECAQAEAWIKEQGRTVGEYSAKRDHLAQYVR